MLIRKGKIIDGAGNLWYMGDVAVRRGKIIEINRSIETEAKHTVDTGGLVVCPGFIDAHSHGDHNSLVYRQMENVIHQVTIAVVAGQCDSSPAPLSYKSRAQAPSSFNTS